MSCVNPANQPIYQALLDRAASYPASMIYKGNAYRKAAESVRTWKYNLYKEHISVVPFVGENIQDFIYCFITTGVTKLYKTGNESIDNARRIAAMNDPMNAPKVPPPTPVPEVNLVPVVNQTINNIVQMKLLILLMML